MSLKIRIVKIYEDNLGQNETVSVHNYVQHLGNYLCKIKFRDRCNYCISLKDNREENVKFEKEKVLKRNLLEDSINKSIHGKNDVIETFMSEKLEPKDSLLIECFRMDENDRA